MSVCRAPSVDVRLLDSRSDQIGKKTLYHWVKQRLNPLEDFVHNKNSLHSCAVDTSARSCPCQPGWLRNQQTNQIAAWAALKDRLRRNDTALPSCIKSRAWFRRCFTEIITVGRAPSTDASVLVFST